MYSKRIVFFGTKGWDLTNRHLQYLTDVSANIAGFVIDGRGSALTTVRSAKAYRDITAVAKELRLPAVASTDVNSPGYEVELKKFNADIFIVCGYQFYLPERIIKIPPLGVLNFHSSLLPRHAGRHPGFWTIWYGDRQSGMTVHFMDKGLDTGGIAYQTRVPVRRGDSVESLYDRIWDTSPGIIEQMLADIENEAIPAVPQDYREYFYNYEITEKDFELDFRHTADVLYGRIKMLPGKFYFWHQGEKIFVHDCEVTRESVKSRNFRLHEPFIIDDAMHFVTPRGFLKINAVSRDGKKIDPLMEK